jgi:cellulose synthase/poly-beta-1,6-N-acetylglucosamine synthase-like glycosyltransferase
MIQTILHIFFLILFVYLAINTLYFFVVAIAGKLYRKPVYGTHAAKKRIAVLIPSYKEDHIIVTTARKAAEHNYPRSAFDVFVAADQLQPETIAALRAIPVHVLEVQFEIGSKARSLNRLLNHIPENDYEVAIILDADNIMMPGCLEKVNHAYQHGFRAVQGHRIAKNRNTPVAILDAMSEEINNHIFRRGQRALGFSCSTIGSGMAFEFKKLKEVYNKPGILGNPACDREVDFEIMKADICIEFIDDAYVLDEKVSSKAVYERQRMRWMESQIIHLRLFFDKKNGPVPKTKDYWNRLFYNMVPPRLIFLASYFLVFVLFAIEYLTGFSFLYPSYTWWLVLTATYLITFLIALPAGFYSWSTLKAMAHIPLLVFSVFRALFNMKVSRKEFLHTPKAFTENTKSEV